MGGKGWSRKGEREDRGLAEVDGWFWREKKKLGCRCRAEAGGWGRWGSLPQAVVPTQGTQAGTPENPTDSRFYPQLRGDESHFHPRRLRKPPDATMWFQP